MVPWETAATAPADFPASRRTFRSPSSTARDGSSGIDGVLVVKTSPVVSSTATTSVNVPPVSIPMRRRPDLSGIKPNARRGYPFSNATQASRSASRPSRTFWKKATSSLSARRRGRGRSTSTIRTMLEPVLSERPRLMTTTRSDR